jgi:hypothetical protein
MDMRIAFILTCFLFVSCDQLQTLEDFGGIGTGTGGNEALSRGAEKAANLASMQDGFYKNELLYIAFPEEAQQVKEKALQLGLDNQVEKFELTLNRAAEEAAKEAAPIFLNAIKGMTVQDGFAILNGGETAATDFLKSRTTAQLEERFAPVVDRAIEQVELTNYWEPLVTAYNTASIFTGKDEVNADLSAYVTENAIDGLFVHIAKEEQNIRENPQARVTELLKRVFGN